MSTGRTDDDAGQRWSLRTGGHGYEAQVRTGGLTTHVRLLRDGQEIARGKEMDERVVARAEGGATQVVVLTTRLGRVRRVTLRVGAREVDLDPEPGSAAARRLARARRRPWLYATLDVLTALAGVLLPLLGIGAFLKLLVEPLVDRLLGLVPDVDVPSVPTPDLPDLPDVDLPSIPWPRVDLPWLPDWTLPPWLDWILEHGGQVWPVLLAAVLAVHEVRRRARQDALKAGLAEQERRVLLARLAADLRDLERSRAAAGEERAEDEDDLGAGGPEGETSTAAVFT